MKIIELQPTQKTPYVKLTNCSLIITGRSYPENAVGFFKPIQDAVNEVDKYDEFEIEFNLEYLNTSSNKALVYIIKNITEKTKKTVKMTWFIYDGDESTEDLADFYKEMLNNVKITKIII